MYADSCVRRHLLYMLQQICQTFDNGRRRFSSNARWCFYDYSPALFYALPFNHTESLVILLLTLQLHACELVSSSSSKSSRANDTTKWRRNVGCSLFAFRI